MDGFHIPEFYGTLLLDEGGGDVNVQNESQVVRNGVGEVGADEVADGDSGGANQVQGVSFFMGREVDVLNDIERVKDVQEFSGGFAGGGVYMNIEVSQ